MKKSVLAVALLEFKSNMQHDLLTLAKSYEDCPDPSGCWQGICHCVDLWREAEEALNELDSKSEKE